MKHAPKGPITAKDPMGEIDPIPRTARGAVRCKARSKVYGRPCQQPAIRGGTVCRYHGGAAPQVIASAEARLLALQHPAISRLSRLIDQEQYPTVAYAASRDVLDRTMGRPRESVSMEHSGGIDITWRESE